MLSYQPTSSKLLGRSNLGAEESCLSFVESIILTNTIRQKASSPEPFQSKAELSAAVDKYSKYNLVDAEEFAQTYGWPIDRWDVSRVEDFCELFYYKQSFNENRGSWDLCSMSQI